MSPLQAKPIKPLVYALIGARGGSKGIPGKNLALILGHPLIAFSIAAAKLCQHIERVIVSTDDEKIAAVARRYGAEVPFMRPKELAGDHSLDIGFFRHSAEWFEEHENKTPD